MATPALPTNATGAAQLPEASPAITIEDVTVAYRSYKQRPTSLKESALRFVRTGVLKHYDTFNALENISFEIERGKVFGIIGSNGSGKSTLLKVLAGVLVPTKGSVAVDGSMTSLIELGAGFDPELSAVENIYLNGSLHRKTKAEIATRIEHILEFANLEDFASTPIKYYSSGMYARLGFSVAIDIDPDILVVDEILAVGDERFQRKCQEAFNRFLSSGKTIVMVSHDLAMLQSLADRVAVLSRGQLAFLGDPKTAVEVYRGSSYQAALETPPLIAASPAPVAAAPVQKPAVRPTRVRPPHGKSILCFLNHYCSETPPASTHEHSVRKAHIETALDQLKGLGKIDIKVCGMRGRSLLPIDVDCSYLSDPALLAYESLHRMIELVGKYDYYINIEEDIFIPDETFSSIVEFDKTSLVNECLHPNRIAIRDGMAHCVDLEALPGWTTQRKVVDGAVFKVALNPHSGLLILSDQKLRYSMRNIDLGFRGRVFGGLASSAAYAHFHSPFSLFRSCDDITLHSVIDLIQWAPQQLEPAEDSAGSASTPTSLPPSNC